MPSTLGVKGPEPLPEPPSFLKSVARAISSGRVFATFQAITSQVATVVAEKVAAIFEKCIRSLRPTPSQPPPVHAASVEEDRELGERVDLFDLAELVKTSKSLKDPDPPFKHVLFRLPISIYDKSKKADDPANNRTAVEHVVCSMNDSTETLLARAIKTFLMNPLAKGFVPLKGECGLLLKRFPSFKGDDPQLEGLTMDQSVKDYNLELNDTIYIIYPSSTSETHPPASPEAGEEDVPNAET